MPDSPLFQPFPLAGLHLNNRMVMAPMTRSRTTQPGNIPNALMADYYCQRASAGLIITEATQISEQGQGYSFTPGIYTPEHIAGWKIITDAVHAKGGKIFLQLWHVGRMTHPCFHHGEPGVAPSALMPDARVWIVNESGIGNMVECPMPRELALHEIPGIVNDFRRAAANAMAAGFDGVEIHGANGYLIDQFLRSTSNHRTDAYGGSIENRVRFLVEVAKAVADEVGAERTGVRLAPFITARGMNCPEIIPAILVAAKHLNALNLAYIHLAEADWDDAPTVPDGFREELRAIFKGAIIVAGRYDTERATHLLEKNLVDLVAFGRPFIANPDLPRRIAEDLPFNPMDMNSLFGGDAGGYTDYPFAP